MGWYKTGNVSCTNGSPTITGAGADWLNASVRQGHAFVGPDDRTYEILSVNSATSITLAENYRGTTTSGQAYKVIPTQGEIRDATVALQALIATYAGVVTGAGAGKFGDGSAATPSISFAADADTGFYRSTDNRLGISLAGVNAIEFSTSLTASTASYSISKSGSVDLGYGASVTGFAAVAVGVNNTALGNAFGAPAGSAYFGLAQNVPLVFTQSANERMRLDGGNLVIGGTSAKGRLDVVGATSALGGRNVLDDDGSFLPRLTQYKWSGSGDNYYATRISTSGVGDLLISLAGTASIGSHTFVRRLLIDAAGNVVMSVPNVSVQPTLDSNGQACFNAVSDTVARYRFRGSDGITRHCDFALTT